MATPTILAGIDAIVGKMHTAAAKHLLGVETNNKE